MLKVKVQHYAGGTNSVALLINSIHWRYKSLLFKSTPTLEVQPYAGDIYTADPYSI